MPCPLPPQDEAADVRLRDSLRENGGQEGASRTGSKHSISPRFCDQLSARGEPLSERRRSLPTAAAPLGGNCPRVTTRSPPRPPTPAPLRESKAEPASEAKARAWA